MYIYVVRYHFLGKCIMKRSTNYVSGISTLSEIKSRLHLHTFPRGCRAFTTSRSFNSPRNIVEKARTRILSQRIPPFFHPRIGQKKRLAVRQTRRFWRTPTVYVNLIGEMRLRLIRILGGRETETIVWK